ncbi:sensor domain-containing diguanylate cyclase [Beijerinckia sp. L45]|uniref:GGDEF domain-containing protein n=1 Tax=Beijerinckia sp. L45 TaxID=1641855 RepID=UPI00131BE844|nr:sensor domain-containing diguanylate cyclase [Beijerinckia sp. L45]
MSGVHHANHMFRRFLERISDCAIFVLSRDGHVESWNDGAHTIIGYTAAEIVGKSALSLLDAEMRDAGLFQQALAMAASEGRFETEFWQTRKDGSRFWAGITVTAILDDAGQTAGFGVMLRDLTERVKAEEQKAGVIALLEKTAGTDFLTGVANRRALDAYLITSIAAARAQNRSLVVAMIDLDHFKAYNDANGHQAGDLYLKEVIVVWRHVLRYESLLARYGGEEFTIIMPDTTVDQAIAVMDRLRAVTPVPITCSIGIAQWDGAESADALIDRADRGLYAAKAAGRNRVAIGPGSEIEAAQDDVIPQALPARQAVGG